MRSYLDMVVIGSGNATLLPTPSLNLHLHEPLLMKVFGLLELYFKNLERQAWL